MQIKLLAKNYTVQIIVSTTKVDIKLYFFIYLFIIIFVKFSTRMLFHVIKLSIDLIFKLID